MHHQLRRQGSAERRLSAKIQALPPALCEIMAAPELHTANASALLGQIRRVSYRIATSRAAAPSKVVPASNS